MAAGDFVKRLLEELKRTVWWLGAQIVPVKAVKTGQIQVVL